MLFIAFALAIAACLALLISADAGSMLGLTPEQTGQALPGVILLIVALGLYQLFIDEKSTLPSWLRIRTLDELKHRVIGVICVVLGVNFLSNVAEWTGGKDIIYQGAAIGIVLAALVLLLKTVDDSIQEEVKLLREERELNAAVTPSEDG